MSDILFPGITLKDFKVKLDENDPILKQKIADTQKRQKAILAQKNIDYEQLKHRITI
jgi:hypothetical protein